MSLCTLCAEPHTVRAQPIYLRADTNKIFERAQVHSYVLVGVCV